VAVSPSPDQHVIGRVASVNPKGIKLEGQDDRLTGPGPVPGGNTTVTARTHSGRSWRTGGGQG
jgi:hypothetical protein